jgi:hypothetical protein
MRRVTRVTWHALELCLLSIFGDYSWRAHMWKVSSSYFWIFFEGALLETLLVIHQEHQLFHGSVTYVSHLSNSTDIVHLWSIQLQLYRVSLKQSLQ